MPAVTFYAYDASDLTRTTELEGVSVFVYSVDGTALIDTGETDASGEVVFELPDETYWVRFFKSGFSFPKKLSVEVDGEGIYDVAGTNLDIRPSATSPNLCRVSGLIVGPSGEYLPDVSIEFVISDTTRITAGTATGATKLQTNSDRQGRVEFDLIRGARYEVYVESYDGPLFIAVPDVSSTGFTDLIWPYVAHVDLEETAVALVAGDTATIGFTTTLSNGWEGDVPLDPESPLSLSPSILASSTDTSVARVIQGESLEIIAVGAGTCAIVFTPAFAVAYRTPEELPTLSSIAVVVTNE